MTFLILLLIVFVGGWMWGAMYEPKEVTSIVDDPMVEEDPIAAELIELNDFERDEIYEIVKRKETTDHPIEKIAHLLEKITISIFEKLTNILYAFVNLLF